MSGLVLVRHGRPAAGWDADPDPGLDPEGVAQAERMAAALAPSGPLPIVVSPKRRTRETAGALERVWGTTATVEPDVGEIPSPTDDLGARGAWLRGVVRGRWPTLDPDLRAWRDRVVELLVVLNRDTVVVTHFVAINVAVGAATGDDRVLVFRPDYCSRTVLDVAGGQLRVVELGAEAATAVR